MPSPVPEERRHRTDYGTKLKSDSVLVFVDTYNGLTGVGASRGSPPVVRAIDIAQPEVAQSGGITETRRIAAMTFDVLHPAGVPQPEGAGGHRGLHSSRGHDTQFPDPGAYAARPDFRRGATGAHDDERRLLRSSDGAGSGDRPERGGHRRQPTSLPPRSSGVSRQRHPGSS